MDEEKEEQEQSGFKVTDRRQFTSEGEVRQEEPQQPAPAQPPPPQEQQPPKASQEEEASQIPPQDSSQVVDFASFLLSLATTGMVHLGEIPEPNTGQKSEDLEGARQMIDILSLLQEKTEGNLSGEEAKLLESLLYELRMKFLSKSKAVEL
ncbi:MAG: DUF1844 domain-containing protein [Acidobacteria bacterium]|nr:DUF1844 domain-containing protein [Acidobacteriota bacterium]MCZ6877388.1 DUF1844 domain-containing protein [Acidobacteriota bacterium]